MNAETFAAYQKQREPHKRFAYHKTHTPPCIGMYAESLGRFALLASIMDGDWVKFSQELIIGDVISPNPEGWVEVTLKDVHRIYSQEIAELGNLFLPLSTTQRRNGMEIDGVWLVKTMGFGETPDAKGRPIYYMNGLHLTYWPTINCWRWQVGGTENMWEYLHTPTQEFVRVVLKALGNPGA